MIKNNMNNEDRCEIRKILDYYATISNNQLKTVLVPEFMNWFNTSHSSNSMPNIASVIKAYMQKYYDIDDSFSLGDNENELKHIVRTWGRVSDYEMFNEFEKVIGQDISEYSNKGFINELDYVLHLSPSYSFVQEKLYLEYGISSEISIGLCNDVDSYLSDKQNYLTVRKVLDNYGLQELSYHLFKQWWGLPDSQHIDFSGYSTLETIVENHYISEDDDTEIDFSAHEQSLTAIIKKHYSSDSQIMFNELSREIGYEIPHSEYESFLGTIDFFTNFSPIHNSVQHQLNFSPYNMPTKLSKQLVQDMLACEV